MPILLKNKQEPFKMKNKLALFILALTLIVSVIPFSLAQEVYSAGKPVELKFLCTLNNEVPTAATYNFTISYPNGTTFINNKQATSLGQGTFNYTVNFSISGTYKVQSFCYDGTYSYSNTEEIVVTPSGIIATSAQSNLSIGLLISIILIMFFFGLLAFKLMDYEKIYPIAIFFLLVAIIIAVYGLYLGVVFSRDYLFASTAAPQSALFVGILYGLVGMMFLGLLWIIIAAVKEIRERKSLQRHGEGWDSKTKQYKY